MRINAAKFGGENIETVWENGKEYLKFSMVPMTEMVLDYPEWDRSEYLPASEIEESADRWNGMPLVTEHPEGTTPEEIGVFSDPEAFENGQKLRGTAHIDVERAETIGGLAERVVADLRANNEVEVSAGYTLDETGRQGRHNGTKYELEQQSLQPDHIAIFPKGEFTPRCSPQDGCAAPRANCVDEDCNCNSTMTENNRTNANGYPAGGRAAWEAKNPDQATMPDYKLNNVRRRMDESPAERKQEEQKRANHAGIPAPVDELTDEESEYPSGRENYQERKEAGETGPTVQNPESRKTPSWEKDAVIED